MTLIISFVSSYQINKVNPALTAPFPIIVLSNLFIAFEAKMLTNRSKLSLAKEIAKSVINFFYLNYITKNQEIHLIELF